MAIFHVFLFFFSFTHVGPGLCEKNVMGSDGGRNVFRSICGIKQVRGQRRVLLLGYSGASRDHAEPDS